MRPNTAYARCTLLFPWFVMRQNTPSGMAETRGFSHTTANILNEENRRKSILASNAKLCNRDESWNCVCERCLPHPPPPLSNGNFFLIARGQPRRLNAVSGFCIWIVVYCCSRFSAFIHLLPYRIHFNPTETLCTVAAYNWLRVAAAVFIVISTGPQTYKNIILAFNRDWVRADVFNNVIAVVKTTTMPVFAQTNTQTRSDSSSSVCTQSLIYKNPVCPRILQNVPYVRACVYSNQQYIKNDGNSVRSYSRNVRRVRVRWRVML